MKKFTIEIMSVDDEVDIQEIYNFHFEEEQKKNEVRLYYSSSGKECLNFLNTETGSDIILVLSDINMPEMNGLELLDKIKSVHPNVHVCMVSAYDTYDYKNQAEQKGAASFFSKPVDFEKLKEFIFGELKEKTYKNVS
jgi:DNA-binding NtrC family response regulator